MAKVLKCKMKGYPPPAQGSELQKKEILLHSLSVRKRDHASVHGSNALEE